MGADDGVEPVPDPSRKSKKKIKLIDFDGIWDKGFIQVNMSDHLYRLQKEFCEQDAFDMYLRVFFQSFEYYKGVKSPFKGQVQTYVHYLEHFHTIHNGRDGFNKWNTRISKNCIYTCVGY